MNERIRELVKQAGGYVSLSYEHDGKLILSGEDIVKKFAELIVQECVIQCEREWIRHGADSAHNQAIHGCINSIKQHFGVEE